VGGEISLDEALANFDEQSRYAHDVFVSYSAKQEEKARHVAEALEAKGLSVFFAPVGIRHYVLDKMTGQYSNPL
jgi:3-hydroxyisobutyrate dehydrogenase-like beta-hydroxyacid dehydrogenase